MGELRSHDTRQSSTVIGVQYLRGVAAFLVVVDHTAGIMASPQYFGRSPGAFFIYGAVGVSIFFVISGFIIAAISLDRDINRRLTINQFYRRRFARIVPFMWSCVIVYNLMRYLGTGNLSWDPFLRAIVLWPVGEIRPNVLWTLRHELLFYLLFGITMLGTIKRPWLLIAWFLSPFLIWFLHHVVPGGLAISKPLLQWEDFFASGVNLAFGSGFVLGLLYVRDSVLLRPRLDGGFPLAVLLGFTLFAFLAITNAPYENFWVSVGITGLSTLVVWCGICLRSGSGPVSQFGHFLGDASYSVYLIHNLVLLVLLTAIVRYHLVGNIWIAYAGLVVAATAGGCAVHIFVERPMVRVAGRLVARRSAPERRNPATA